MLIGTSAAATADVMSFAADGTARVTSGWTFHGRGADAARREVGDTRAGVGTPGASRSEIVSAVADAARRHADHPALRGVGMDGAEWGRLFRAVVEVESGYDPAAVSTEGALGLGQLMPGTARDLGVDPLDPAQNLDGAARYLLAQVARFGSVEWALAAYNAGPERVARHGGVPPIGETQAYVERVARTYERLSGGAGDDAPEPVEATGVGTSVLEVSAGLSRPPVLLDLQGAGGAEGRP